MTKISNLDPSKVLGFFSKTFIVVFILGITLILVSLISTGQENSTFSKKLCFTNSCLKYTYNIFSETIKLSQAFTSLLTSIATIGGIVVAVFTYINSVKTNALNNHISHFQIFSNCIISECQKRDMLSISSIDIFHWYNSIFKRSRDGIMTVSNEYRRIIKDLNTTICVSNERCQKASKESFRYKVHQSEMIETLKTFKISLEMHPRNEFYEIEGQVLGLIQTVNNAFAANSNLEEIADRAYI